MDPRLRAMVRAGSAILLLSTLPIAAQGMGGAGGPPLPGGAPGDPASLLRRLDRDGDGRISRSEAGPRILQDWDRLDRNADGAVTVDELRSPGGGARSGQPEGTLPSAGREPSSVQTNVPARIRGPARVFVWAEGPAAAGDGTAWERAFRELQSGIDRAAELGGGEVWVAGGTYLPTLDGDREATFRLRPGVGVLGGFRGVETQREQRDWERNPTLLSGDIGRLGSDSDNSFHVVTGTDNSLLDGFVVTAGNGMGGGGGPRGGEGPGMGGGPGVHTTPEALLAGAGRGAGGGMVNLGCAPTVRNCVFRGNQAMKGGAVYNLAGGRSFRGAAVSVPAPLFEDCVFEANWARARGGGVSNDMGAAPVFRRCRFFDNRCSEKGGGMYNDFGCSPTLTHCLFVGNTAFRAGAMGNDGASCPVVACCTITANRAEDAGAGLYQGTGPSNDPTILRSILWGNLCENGPADLYNWHDCSPLVRESCVGGGWPGEGNVDVDPRFRDAERRDFALRPESPCPTAGMTAPLPTLLPVPKLEMRHVTPPREAKAAAGNGPRVFHVRPDGPADGDGATWATACRDPQVAMDAAYACGGEVWVCAGIYLPTGTDRGAAFRLRAGVSVHGGFRGDETERDQRRPEANVTVFSGDLGKPGDISDNAFHVLTGADDAVLDGVTISGGNADGMAYDAKGGGMICYVRGPQGRPGGPATGTSPTLRGCVFRGNVAREGGAVYSYDRGTPVFEDCLFEGNAAENGGAVADRVGVRSRMRRCRFVANTARYRGGALYLDYGCRPEIEACTFTGNRSAVNGGGVYLTTRASQLENTVALLRACVFAENTAAGQGGAIANEDKSVLLLDTCTFRGNAAAAGADIDTRRQATTVLEGTPLDPTGMATDPTSQTRAGTVASFPDPERQGAGTGGMGPRGRR
ncbi:MAG: right-handed parallel beta-helix repeat-containing protein [Lentisphaeria bacterium]|nr:right-handed parallel beta-helix repeat-containing protein [Lentisphaeria bacterium]